MGRISLKMDIPRVHSVRGRHLVPNVVRQVVQERADSHIEEIKTWQQRCQ